MKKIKLLVATAIIAVSFTACEKECVEPVRKERPVIKIDPAEIQAKASSKNATPWILT